MYKSIEHKNIKEPSKLGSYSSDDVVFLLKDISESIVERGTEEREEVIQGGGHYSEMLPIEYKPSDEYINLYHKAMDEFSDKIAESTAVVAENIIKKRGSDTVLISLARAGTPFGILIKRYIKEKYGIEIPHYAISIIRGKGIDENALIYIIKKHGTNIQFVDGWTGKGTITNVLNKAVSDFYDKYEIRLNGELAVISDPGHCAPLYGTRDDFLLPSSFLNSTVSGLISRTVHRKDLIDEEDFHGVKYYKELTSSDLSNEFLDKISEKFEKISKLEIENIKYEEISFNGLKDIEKIKKEFNIEDINFIKPGIGESTRVLLRRVPWKILVNSKENKNLEHILVLAKEKGVEVIEYKMSSYQCCGIIKPLNRTIQ